MGSTARVVLGALVALLAFPGAAAAREELWALLEAGGHVALLRHAITTAGVGDPPGMRLDDCRTQRNLTEEGRRHARQVGEAFRARGVAVEQVLSSPWCRCIETARLVFGAHEVWAPLGNLLTAPECADHSGLYGADGHFRRTVVMALHGFGKGEYK